MNAIDFLNQDNSKSAEAFLSGGTKNTAESFLYADEKPVKKSSFLSDIGRGMSDMARAESEAGRGAAEGLATTAIGGTAWIPEGIANIADIGAAAAAGQTPTFEMGKNVANFYHIEPKTEVGKGITKVVQAPFVALEKGQKAAGEAVYKATQNPYLAAAAETAIGAVPFAAPVAVGKGIKKVKADLRSIDNMKGIVDGQKVERVTSAKEFLEQPKEPVKTEANPYVETPKSEIVEPVSTPKADRPSGETVTKPPEAVSANVERPVPVEKPTLLEVEAEMKPHRTAQRVEVEAISRELLDREGLGEDIAKYEVEKGMMEAQARMGVEIMDRDYNAAVKMAMGEIPAPEGVRPGTMVTAVAKRAFEKGDFETAYKLGTTSEAFTVAKEIAKDLKSFDQGLNNNPVTAMQSVIKARKEELARTGEKIDPVKQNAEIERLKTLLDNANKRLEEQTVKDKPKQRYGSQNKIVTQSEYLRVKEELRAQLGSQLSAGIDPTIAAKMVKIGTYHLEAGARSFASWSKVVLEDVGEWAKPHLEDIWKQTQESIRPISNEAKNSQRYKTRLQNEVKKYSERFETFDFRKEERNKANLSSEGRRIKEERDRIKTAYDAAVRKTGGISREEATILFDLAKRAAELKNLRDPNVKGNFGFKSAKERWEYGKAQAAFDKYVAKLKIGDESISTLAKNRLSEFKTEVKDNPAKAVGKLGIDAVGEVSATSISMVASLDASFTLRQGGKMLMTHPTIWAKSVSKQVGDIYKSLRYKHGNEIAKDILHADLVSRENYMDGHYQKAGILAKFEEQYPTSHPGRIPGIGRPFKASEVAFTNTALRMRIGYFDLLLDMAKKNGAEINTKLIKDLGAVVNGLTARSHIGGSKFVNVVLWAPRMMMANVNVLTGHGLGAGLSTKFARIEAAKNLIKITAETAAVAAVLNAIVPGSVELDPRSSDFLKYKDGNTRIDMTAGSGQYITLVARFLTGQTKNTQTKIIKDLDKSGFGDRTYFDVGMDFLINKTTPLVRQGVYFAKNRNFEGRKPTLGTAAIDLTVPIPVKNIADDTFGDYSDERAIVLISNMADIVGVNANTYMPLDQWDNKKSKELTEFRKQVGEKRFEEANIRYNKIVNSRISQTTRTPYYRALSDEEKEKVITRIRKQTKQQILSGY